MKRVSLVSSANQWQQDILLVLCLPLLKCVCKGHKYFFNLKINEAEVLTKIFETENVTTVINYDSDED